MVRCSFCSEVVKEGRGKMYVKTDGKIFYYCNSKCQKNWQKKREGKTTKWTRAFRKFREKTGASTEKDIVAKKKSGAETPKA